MPYTPAQMKRIKLLASCGVPQSIIAENLGVPSGTFGSHMRRWPSVAKAYHLGAGKAKERLIETAYNLATVKKNVSMTIFLLKARCGFRENTKDAEEDADTKAQLARETLDKMNAGLAPFQAPDGSFATALIKKIAPTKNMKPPARLKRPSKLKAPKSKKLSKSRKGSR